MTLVFQLSPVDLSISSVPPPPNVFKPAPGVNLPSLVFPFVRTSGYILGTSIWGLAARTASPGPRTFVSASLICVTTSVIGAPSSLLVVPRLSLLVIAKGAL